MTERVLPKQSLSRDDATRIARGNGWQYHDLFLPDGEQPFEKIWLTEDGTTSVHWIEDPVLELNYFAVQGEHRDDIVRALREGTETFGRDELRAMLDAAPDWPEFLLALHHVAAAAPPEFDEEIHSWFERGLRHDEPAVRKMTAILTSYPGWPELRAALERLRADDDEEVRAVADQMLAQP